MFVRHAAKRVAGYRQASTFTSIPVIDATALVQPNQRAAAKAAVAAQLHAACRDVGFFYVKNHGIPAALQQGILQQARAWFDLPEAVKNEILIRPDKHFRGYQRLGANVTRYDGGYQRDWHEAIDLYREADAAAVAAQGLPASPIHGPNQWPVQRPAFDQLLRLYLNSMLGLGSSLMRGIALGLGLEEHFFDGQRAAIQDSYWCARVIHYPPLTEGTFHRSSASENDASSSDPAGSSGTAASAAAAKLHDAAAAALKGAEVDRAVQLSCGEHTDYGLLTLVNQEDHVTALQVKNARGEWIPATPIPGTFVCNIGDMLKVWSNGLYKPTAHRVINADPSLSRISIPFFYEPAFEARVEPVARLCSADRPPQFPPVRYGNHLESKVLNNFEL
ncbi:hypothetical protein WJX72_002642 [[Myrmecia] bisecta]|uniref:Fe2OG dioxygenase domain-containing protein n=1 Tax=[Myrmecia] bisecta TaxID=41462 RepID=A0AAW1P894_9CHLO